MLFSIGEVHLALYHFDLALEKLTEASKFFQDVDDHHMAANVQFAVVRAAHDLCACAHELTCGLALAEGSAAGIYWCVSPQKS